MNTTLLFTSFLAGMLTVLAPCVLPILPVIVGGTAGTHDKRRPFVIALSLVGSVILFTLVLKASALLIDIPQNFWLYISSSIILLFGLFTLWPELWEYISARSGFLGGSQQLLGTAGKKAQNESLLGAGLLGAALGPVFSSCSPTYFVILATILPVSFAVGILYLFVYGIGLAIVLLAIAYYGQRLTQKLTWAANPHGLFRRGLGVLLILVGLAIVTGVEKKIELALIDAGFGTTNIEERLLESTQEKPAAAQAENVQTTDMLPHLYPAPELSGLTNWLHNEPIESLAALKGKVVLIDFWTYSCINCIRTLPYIQSWHEDYTDSGLVILGLHAPEFQFEHKPENVAKAVKDFGLTYPIAQDNDFATWRAYNNHYWPAKYLIDRDGFVRYTHFGEGEYDETEAAIAELLGEEVKQNAVTATLVNSRKIGTPEIYLGTARRANFVANAAQLRANEWTLSGDWQAADERILTQAASAQLRLKFTAAVAHLVIGGTGTVKVSIDGAAPTTANAGADIIDGVVTLDSERLYELANFGGEYATHEITLEFQDADIAAYAWTFG